MSDRMARTTATRGAVPAPSVGFTTLYVVNPTLDAERLPIGDFLSLCANKSPTGRGSSLAAPFFDGSETLR